MLEYVTQGTMRLFQKLRLKARLETRFYLRRWGILQPEPGTIDKRYIAALLPQDAVIIDAGSYDGADAVELSRLMPKAIIYALEPVPKLYKRLCCNTRRNPRIRVRNCALAANDGKAPIHISEGGSDASSSLLCPSNWYSEAQGLSFAASAEVMTRTLDTFVAEERLPKVDFLWLDLQGMELHVLKAAPKCLSMLVGIHLEVHLKESYEGVVPYPEVREWLANCGFETVQEAIPPNWKEGNVLFVRKHSQKSRAQCGLSTDVGRFGGLTGA